MAQLANSHTSPSNRVGPARPKTPGAPNCWPSSPSRPRWPASAHGLTRVAWPDRARPTQPACMPRRRLSPRWLTGGTPSSSPSLVPSSAFGKQSTGTVGGRKIQCRLDPYPPSMLSQPTSKARWMGATQALAARQGHTRCMTVAARSCHGHGRAVTLSPPYPRLFDQGARNRFHHRTRGRVTTLKP